MLTLFHFKRYERLFFLNKIRTPLFISVHPDAVLDDVEEAYDEPNYNNYNTSPDPPSPYADLEKKYRKNRFNRQRSRNRNTALTDPLAVNGNRQSSPKKANGNKVQKGTKPKKKTSQNVKASNNVKAAPHPATRPARPSQPAQPSRGKKRPIKK